MKTILEQMVHTWTQGGWVMIALAVLALLIYGTAAHLLLRLHYPGLKRDQDADLRRWLKRPEDAPARIRGIIEYTQSDLRSLRELEGRFREVESRLVPAVDRQLGSLGVMVVAAPLFGLLGTVLGMLLTFKAISLGGSSVSEIVAKGISEALVATQSGLTVAIPGWMAAFLAKRWKAEFVSFLLRLESISLRHHRHDFMGMTRVFTKSDFAPRSVPVEPLIAVAAAPEEREAETGAAAVASLLTSAQPQIS